MMDKTAFLKQLEDQLKIHEKAIKDLEEQEAPPEAISQVKQRRDRIITRLNLEGGPLVRENTKPGCCFVRKGGWLRGDE